MRPSTTRPSSSLSASSCCSSASAWTRDTVCSDPVPGYDVANSRARKASNLDVSTSVGECERARQWISAGLDGELSEFEGAVLEGHLAICTACTDFLVETRGLTNALRTAPPDRFTAS